MSVFVERIPNRNSPPAILIRESWRENGKIKRRTLANLSKLPPHTIESIRLLLKGAQVVADTRQAFVIERALPHGHVQAVLGLCRQLGLRQILHRHPGRERDLALAAIVARVLEPASRLTTSRQLSPETATTSLGAMLDLGAVSDREMLDMFDWLVRRQSWIERSLGNRHLRDGTLILYDVTGSVPEGECCPLVALGHSRDGKPGKRQITFGLLCAADGCPIAVQVFEGNRSDRSAVAGQVAKLRERFGFRQLALVGDRGMLTTARIREEVEPARLDWISALTPRDIHKLLKPSEAAPPNEPDPVPLCPKEPVPDALAEITSPDFPGERLVVCLNPRLREEQARKREALLQATEADLAEIAGIIRQPHSKLRGRDRIERRVGREVNRKRVERHFRITVSDNSLAWTRDAARIAAEAQLDGIYIVRTSLPADAISRDDAVCAFRSLACMDRAFRSVNSTQRKLRPAFVYTDDHVRAHVFLCMLAYYLEWHLRQQWAPMLFEDDNRAAASAQGAPTVALADDSEAAKRKARRKITATGRPVHGLRNLLDDLATLTRNEVTLPGGSGQPFILFARPTPLQAEAFQHLGIEPTEGESGSATG